MTRDRSGNGLIEAALLARASEAAPAPIFIVGSPRTGSTFLYQAMAAAFELPYVTNLTNDNFSETPIIGLSIQAAWPSHGELLPESRFGKTDGLFQPSEGSALMRHWFGGGHPSEIVSREVLPGRGEHMQATMRAAGALFGGPLLIKNAWNCFRIDALAEFLPQAAFIWIRRDIEASATSDLNARYVVQGDPNVWNSATPRNVEELKRRPYGEQVVENQVEFARAIADSFFRLSPRRVATVWYEDLCRSPMDEFARLSAGLDALEGIMPLRALPVRSPAESYPALQSGDRDLITAYIQSQTSRMEPHRYRSSPID